MTEDDAKAWIITHHGHEALERLEHYVALLLEANREQNLVSRATEPTIWVRHILDSAQLHHLAPEAPNWLDIGSGPGLPGIVLAILSARPILLVEPRRARVAFLEGVKGALGLGNATVCQSIVEKLSPQTFSAVTARAYAPLPQIFASTVRLTESSTIWVLPKGKSAERELVEARRNWQGTFHVEHSLTDGDARIIVATGVQPR